MLRELHIAGYRSLREISLALEPLTVIVGANGTGKTNLYQALQLLSNAARGALAQSLSLQGGFPSARWAGARKKHEAHRIEVRVEFDELAYELQLGLVPPPEGPFMLDPEVKEERVLVLDRGRHTVAERKGPGAWSRDAEGVRSTFPDPLWGGESMLSQIIEPQRFPLLSELRGRFDRWRFYHSFRTDAEAPARQPQVGTRTPALMHDGRDLAAALMTIQSVGNADALHESIDRAFPGARLHLDGAQGRFSFQLSLPGLLRPLEAAELSDGTLRFLYLLAALLSPRPPPFLALNEPETSLHPDMMEALAELIKNAAARSQIFVVTHAERLAKAMPDAKIFALAKVDGETRVVRGMGE